jgi:hypothetical protein
MFSILFRFITLGTFLGGGAFVITTGIFSDTETGIEPIQLLIAPLAIIITSVFTWFLSFPVGFIPASLCGFIYWLILKKWTNKNFNIFSRIILGACLGSSMSIGFGLTFLYKNISSFSSSIELIGFGVAGLVSGAFCAMIINDKSYSNIFHDNFKNDA